MKNSKLSDKELLTKAFEIYVNPAAVLESFGLKAGSGNYTTLKKYCEQYGIKVKGLNSIRRGRKSRNLKKSTWLTTNSKVARHAIKRYIISENLVEYKCIGCGLGDNWNGKSISLQLEHLNGINNDNRLENLSFICPNCHSQTATYAGKNKKRNISIV